MKLKLMLLAAFVLSCSACRYFHMNPVSVAAWQPEQSCISKDRKKTVSITFSAPMSRINTEQAFAITLEGLPVPGRFRWEANTLQYDILEQFPRTGTYQITVAETAEDCYGNNLSAQFTHTFALTKDKGRPEITRCIPADGSETAEGVSKLTVYFSEPVERNSVYENFSIKPGVEGSFLWEQNDSSFTFVPSQPFRPQIRYRYTVGADTSDTAGNTIGEDFRGEFTSGCGYDVPGLLSAGTPDGSILLTPVVDEEEPSVICGGLETFSNLLLQFSVPVSVASVDRAFSIFPEASVELLPDNVAVSDSITVVFPERLAYDTVYTLHLDTNTESAQGINLPEAVCWRLRTDGPASRPPSIEQVTFLDNPAAGEIQTYSSYDLLQLDNFEPHTPGQESAFFDLYFRTAESAEINILQFMNSFSCSSTNNCAAIEITAAECGVLSGPPPVPPEGDGQTIIRVHISVEDKAGNGIIEFRLDSSMQDSYGNHPESDWYFPLNEATP